jgi:hypothetical protein
MPVHRGIDMINPYYQWGYKGKKYYYISGNKTSRSIAYEKANAQGRAVYASRLWQSQSDNHL